MIPNTFDRYEAFISLLIISLVASVVRNTYNKPPRSEWGVRTFCKMDDCWMIDCCPYIGSWYTYWLELFSSKQSYFIIRIKSNIERKRSSLYVLGSSFEIDLLRCPINIDFAKFVYLRAKKTKYLAAIVCLIILIIITTKSINEIDKWNFRTVITTLVSFIREPRRTTLCTRAQLQEEYNNKASHEPIQFSSGNYNQQASYRVRTMERPDSKW